MPEKKKSTKKQKPENQYWPKAPKDSSPSPWAEKIPLARDPGASPWAQPTRTK